MFDLIFYKIISDTTITTSKRMTSNGYKMEDFITNKKKIIRTVHSKYKDGYEKMQYFYHNYIIGYNEYFKN